MKIGFIDYYLDEWHANNYPRLLAEASSGEMEVANVYALIDSPLPGGRTTAQWCADMKIPACATVEELIEKSDVLVVLSPDNCEMHEQLCQLPLRSGKRTFIDKTFAPDGATAQRIFDLADAYHTPCYSTSALRFAAEYQGIDKQTLQAITSWGPGSYETYAIHQLEPILMLMETKVERVLYLPGKDYCSMALAFEDGRIATLACYAKGSPFTLNLCADSGNRVVTAESDYFRAFIAELVQFFRTGEVRGAGLLAQQQPGQWLTV
ncbi:MAG: hypothetical protein RR482_06675 [Clostridia bacterium]